MNKQTRNEKGFTMIELIVVVAIMGIIGALLVPAFGKMAAKAKLTTDVTTVKTLQRQIDMYNTERATALLVAADNDNEIPVGKVKDLVDAGYLDSKDLIAVTGTPAGYNVRLQSGGKAWVVKNADNTYTVKLYFTEAYQTGNAVVDYIKDNIKADDTLAPWILSKTAGFKL